jgi:hypothetical protein
MFGFQQPDWEQARSDFIVSSLLFVLVRLVVHGSTERGRSSVVERQLPKLNVVGSIPIARSIFSATYIFA